METNDLLGYGPLSFWNTTVLQGFFDNGGGIRAIIK